VLDTDRREVALVGAVRVKATRDRLFDQYRDVSGLRRSQVFLEVGAFSAAPRVEDLRGLTFEDYDLETSAPRSPARRSPSEPPRPGGGLAGARLAQQVAVAAAARDAPPGPSRAGQGARRSENKQVPLSVSDEFRVPEETCIRPAAPEFFAHVETFPPRGSRRRKTFYGTESFDYDRQPDTPRDAPAGVRRSTDAHGAHRDQADLRDALFRRGARLHGGLRRSRVGVPQHRTARGRDRCRA
jgi:hypothetical protein